MIRSSHWLFRKTEQNKKIEPIPDRLIAGSKVVDYAV
jgi:hypothetical protein